MRPSAAARFAAKPPTYVVSNPNVKFFKSALPFIAFCVVGTFFVTRFQSEKLYQSDKARSSMSIAEAKRKEQEAADELERIQQYVNREWVQVPIPGSRDDPSGPRPAKSSSASATARPGSS